MANPAKRPVPAHIQALNEKNAREKEERRKAAAYPAGTIIDSKTFEPIFPDDPRYPKYAGTENGSQPPPTVAELDALLNSEDDRPVVINPDGSITVVDESQPPDHEPPTQQQVDEASALGISIQEYRASGLIKGFTMSDEPPDGIIDTEHSELPPLKFIDTPPADFSPGPGATILDGEIMPPSPAHVLGSVRYESRISIVEAFQYPGNLAQAPAWVDRNWIGFADYDGVRNLEAGPCLRVPDGTSPDGSSGFVICRPGDYVARQEVRLLADMPGEIRIEVWSREQFQRLFLATSR